MKILRKSFDIGKYLENHKHIQKLFESLVSEIKEDKVSKRDIKRKILYNIDPRFKSCPDYDEKYKFLNDLNISFSLSEIEALYMNNILKANGSKFKNEKEYIENLILYQYSPIELGLASLSINAIDLLHITGAKDYIVLYEKEIAEINSKSFDISNCKDEENDIRVDIDGLIKAIKSKKSFLVDGGINKIALFIFIIRLVCDYVVKMLNSKENN